MGFMLNMLDFGRGLCDNQIYYYLQPCEKLSPSFQNISVHTFGKSPLTYDIKEPYLTKTSYIGSDDDEENVEKHINQDISELKCNICLVGQ